MDVLQKQTIVDKFIIDDNELLDNEKPYDSNHRQWYYSGMFHKPDIFKIDKSPLALYMLFRSYEIRRNVSSPFMMRLKKEYFDKGYIVSSLPFRLIEEKTQWSRAHIEKNIKALVKLKWIVVYKIDVGKSREQNVYALAKRNFISGKDEYFINDFLL